MTLKGIRNNLDLTQQEIAEKLGISKETYQNYENYKTFPDVPMIVKIIDLSGVDFNDIIFLPKQYAKSEQPNQRS